MDYRAYPIVLFVWRMRIENSADLCRNLFGVFLYPLRGKKEKALQEGIFIHACRRIGFGHCQPFITADDGIYPRHGAVADSVLRGRDPRGRLDGDPLGVLGSLW